MKILPVSRFLQHVLVLPILEETYRETAALARIWQDVHERKSRAQLTAVYYAKNGIPKDKLEDAEKMLTRDDIDVVYVKELPSYYAGLRGQTRLWPRRH